jgi:HTH-type transcriptional regulator/antitoxin HigA
MTKKQNNQFVPDYASPPGSTLLETIELRGMSQAELAERTGRSKKHINEIVKGKQPITAETALQLERVLGITADFWNNRQREYEETLARIAERRRLSKHVAWAKRFPYSDMVKLGWIAESHDWLERLGNLLNYFGVAGIREWEERWGSPRVAFRRSRAFTSNRYAVAAWLRRGETMAHATETKPYDETRLLTALKTARGLTRSHAKEYIPKVKSLCADAGVALALVRELRGTHTYGATQWLTPEKALIQLSLRGKTDDHFWFAFIHEAGHIIKHGKKDKFIEAEGRFRSEDKREAEADKFACDFLIPRPQYDAFVSDGDFGSYAITEFAERLGIAPGIVVGRLQHDHKIEPSYHNRLKVRLAWAEPTTSK